MNFTQEPHNTMNSIPSAVKSASQTQASGLVSPEREREIPREMQNLHSSINHLHMLLDNVSERLASLLPQEVGVTSSMEKIPSCASEMGASINNAYCSIVAANNRIDYLLSKLEL